jgi:serine/threonine protein kinase
MFGWIDAYSDIELLGEGGMGQVWKAVDRNANRFVAKKYLKSFAPEDRKRFEREARMLFGARGVENIVQIIDYRLEFQNPYIVTEFCEGGSLASKVGTFDHIQATNVLSCMVKALKFIHSQGGIHRDIKPANILLAFRNGGWVSKLADFGIARNPAIGTAMTQTPIGTREYFAPEVLRGENFTQAADIYSLGLTIRELITGSREVTLNTWSIPFRLASLLGEMLAPDARNRPTIYQVEERVNAIIQSRSDPVGNLISSASPVTVGLGLLVGLALTALADEK